jgi:hypothetical protein
MYAHALHSGQDKYWQKTVLWLVNLGVLRWAPVYSSNKWPWKHAKFGENCACDGVIQSLNAGQRAISTEFGVVTRGPLGPHLGGRGCPI